MAWIRLPTELESRKCTDALEYKGFVLSLNSDGSVSKCAANGKVYGIAYRDTKHPLYPDQAARANIVIEIIRDGFAVVRYKTAVGETISVGDDVGMVEANAAGCVKKQTLPDTVSIDTVANTADLSPWRKVVYKRAEDMLVGIKIIPIVETDFPFRRFMFPSKIDVSGPMSWGAAAPMETITWTKLEIEMPDKYEGRFLIDDIAEEIQMAQEQFRSGVRRLAESMSRVEDKEILDAIDAAKGAEITITTAWNKANADPISDMANAISKILEAPDITTADLKNIRFVIPHTAWTELIKLTEINGIRTSRLDWFQDTYGVQFLPTNRLEKDGYAVVAGADTGRHYVFRPRRIPLVEEVRVPGRGRAYVVRRAFTTVIIPDEAPGTTTKRICKLTGVIA